MPHTNRYYQGRIQLIREQLHQTSHRIPAVVKTVLLPILAILVIPVVAHRASSPSSVSTPFNMMDPLIAEASIGPSSYLPDWLRFKEDAHMTNEQLFERLKANIIIRGVAEVLKYQESYSAKPYLDSRGFWTKGYGARCEGPKSPSVTEAQAYQNLIDELTRVVAVLDVKYPWWKKMSQARRQALLSFTYNVGVSDTGVGEFPKMLKALEKGQYRAAAHEVLYSGNRKSKYWTQVGDRALQIANAFLHDDWQFMGIETSQFDLPDETVLPA